MRRVVFILILFIDLMSAYPQNDSVVVRPIAPSIPFQTIMSQYLYAETSWAQYNGINTAGNNFNTGTESLYRSSYGIGLHADFHLLSYNPHSMWADFLDFFNYGYFAINVGYTYDKFSYNQDRWSNVGYHSHWLTFEVGWYGLHFLYIGLRSDIYLGSSSVSPDGWSYNGINPDCYNRTNFIPIFGIKLNYSNIFMELLLGFDYVKINEKKLSLYNFVSTHNMYPKEDIYLQIRIGIRSFTNSNKTL